MRTANPKVAALRRAPLRLTPHAVVVAVEAVRVIPHDPEVSERDVVAVKVRGRRRNTHVRIGRITVAASTIVTATSTYDRPVVHNRRQSVIAIHEERPRPTIHRRSDPHAVAVVGVRSRIATDRGLCESIVEVPRERVVSRLCQVSVGVVRICLVSERDQLSRCVVAVVGGVATTRLCETVAGGVVGVADCGPLRRPNDVCAADGVNRVSEFADVERLS
jgi:hypothetical protein